MGLTVSCEKRIFLTTNCQKCQKCRLILTVKIFKTVNLAFFSISGDRHGLLAPEISRSRLEDQFPCSLLDITTTLELAYI